MARKNRRTAPESRAGSGTGGTQRVEQWRGVPYLVRSITGQAAIKPYRCPGCDQLIGPGSPHVVAWPTDDLDAAGRRHWHAVCWAARETRWPGVQRGRSAPRY